MLIERSSPNLSLSLTIHPYCLSLLGGPLDDILCPHKVDVCKSFLTKSKEYILFNRYRYKS